MYNVTYVTQTTTSSGKVESSYTAGLFRSLRDGCCCWCRHRQRHRDTTIRPMSTIRRGMAMATRLPVYYPRPTATYGYAVLQHHDGAYGWAQTAYGPYGSATRTASYNPYTGTSTRTVSGSTSYGRKALGRPTTPIPGRTPLPIKDRVPRRSGVNPTFRTEINPRTRSTTRPRKEPWHPCRGRRAERQSGLPPPTAMLPWARLQTETCMLGRTETSTRIRARAGKNMTTVPAPGTP